MTQRQFRARSSEAAARSTDQRPVADGRRAPRLTTFMVVDLAGAEAILAELGERRVETSRAAYLALLRNAITTHRGRELLRQDDRALVAFATPSLSVACAVSIQQAAERHNRTHADRLDPRIGIQLGEATEPNAVSDQGEYIARPAIQARQLCQGTLGGHILVSDLVSALARPDTVVTFERAGLIDLTGAADPVATFEVRYE